MALPRARRDHLARFADLDLQPSQSHHCNTALNTLAHQYSLVGLLNLPGLAVALVRTFQLA